mgnify:CR=1 FL=1
MPPKIKLDKDVLDRDSIDVGECTHPAGHCFGSDGGSGIPENLKVPTGRGGEKEVWTLDALKEKVEAKEIYLECQYCGKMSFSHIKDEKEII